MADAASVKSVNILVDIVISVVLRRLNSDLENVDSERLMSLSAACELCGNVASLGSRSGWAWGLGLGPGGCGAVCACSVLRPPARDREEAGRGRDVQSESVLSFYFTNKQKT
mgnify:CR=1 FL=1